MNASQPSRMSGGGNSNKVKEQHYRRSCTSWDHRFRSSLPSRLSRSCDVWVPSELHEQLPGKRCSRVQGRFYWGASLSSSWLLWRGREPRMQPLTTRNTWIFSFLLKSSISRSFPSWPLLFHFSLSWILILLRFDSLLSCNFYAFGGLES